MDHLTIDITVTALVWLVANGVYLKTRWNGEHGASRVFGFLLGLPTTFLTMLFVREGRTDRVTPLPDADAELLRDVRRDRRLRAERGEGPTDDGRLLADSDAEGFEG